MKLFPFLRTNARWLAAGAMLSFLSSFGQTFFIAIFSGKVRAAFDLSHGQWGGAYTLGTTASAAVMVWAGGLTDRYRSRVLGSVVLSALAGACLFMALNPVAWLLPLAIFGLRLAGQGMSSHIAIVSMSRWFIATRGKALSIAGLGIAFGEAIMPVTFVSLMLVLDWRLLWVVAAVIVLLCIPILRILLREERTPQSMADSEQSNGMSGRQWTRNQTFRHWLFWIMVPALLGPPAFSTAFFFHQVHFAGIKGWDHLQLVSMFPLYTAVGVTSMLVTGWALDRFGTSRVLPWYQLPSVAAFWLFATGDSMSSLLLGLVFLGMTQGGNSTLPSAFWAEFFGTRHLGSIKALGAAVMVFGSAIGPGLTGVLIDSGIGIQAQYRAVAAYFVLSTILMVLGVGRARRLL
ncbi:MFS transporter [Puniceibacterium sp. IMCC21224]|uniref:MFS transporter n=1 Tax=Puniceibacterium sp. IMCC21224 TaxID=1618204 RepID=UPI00064DB222|nr:MFS transporter [Puniceibacterium sp. IMCC21224]KMK65400.1 arabinose efflux permease family protein [Puniceibacterium sp. IMCC21224]